MQGGKTDEENQTLGSSDYGMSADIDRGRGSACTDIQLDADCKKGTD